MDREPRLSIRTGHRGWTEVRWHAADELVCYIRFIDEPAGMLQAEELRFLGPDVARFRELPLGRVERALNASAGLRGRLLAQINRREPRDLPAHFAPPPAADVRVTVDAAAAAAVGGDVRTRLTRPSTRRLPDAFYAEVAAAYRDAVAAGLNPRKALARDSGTPADTVARWIGEARRRGHLPPGEAGKVTA